MFAGVTSIQRVNTDGGAAPTRGCGPDNVGAEARVAYRADYYFYKRAERLTPHATTPRRAARRSRRAS